MSRTICRCCRLWLPTFQTKVCPIYSRKSHRRSGAGGGGCQWGRWHSPIGLRVLLVRNESQFFMEVLNEETLQTSDPPQTQPTNGCVRVENLRTEKRQDETRHIVSCPGTFNTKNLRERRINRNGGPSWRSFDILSFSPFRFHKTGSKTNDHRTVSQRHRGKTGNKTVPLRRKDRGWRTSTEVAL